MRLADGPVLRAVWEEGEAREREAVEAFRGLMALITAGDEESLARQVEAFEQPLVPSVEGGRVVAAGSPKELLKAVKKSHTARWFKKYLRGD